MPLHFLLVFFAISVVGIVAVVVHVAAIFLMI